MKNLPKLASRWRWHDDIKNHAIKIEEISCNLVTYSYVKGFPFHLNGTFSRILEDFFKRATPFPKATCSKCQN